MCFYFRRDEDTACRNRWRKHFLYYLLGVLRPSDCLTDLLLSVCPPTELTCEKTEMTLVLPVASLTNIKLNELQLNSPSCPVSYNDTYLVAHIPLGGCGTKTVVSFKIVFITFLSSEACLYRVIYYSVKTESGQHMDEVFSTESGRGLSVCILHVSLHACVDFLQVLWRGLAVGAVVLTGRLSLCVLARVVPSAYLSIGRWARLQPPMTL